MYGAPLTVPGDFIANHGPQQDHSFQLQRLRDQVGSLAPVPTARHGTAPASVPAGLQQAKFVFVHRDAHRNSLQCPYEGPFRVIENGSKTFKIDMGGRTETITVDRLKLDAGSPVQLAQPRPRPPSRQDFAQSKALNDAGSTTRQSPPANSSEALPSTHTSGPTTPATHQSRASSSSE